MSPNDEGNDSVAIGVHSLNGEEEISTVLTFETVDGDSDAGCAGKRSSKCVIIALNVHAIGEVDLSLLGNGD